MRGKRDKRERNGGRARAREAYIHAHTAGDKRLDAHIQNRVCKRVFLSFVFIVKSVTGSISFPRYSHTHCNTTTIFVRSYLQAIVLKLVFKRMHHRTTVEHCGLRVTGRYYGHYGHVCVCVRVCAFHVMVPLCVVMLRMLTERVISPSINWCGFSEKL